MKEAAIITMCDLLGIGFISFTDTDRYEAEQHAKRAYLELEVRYKEAESEVARLRVLELKYSCELINRHGETFAKEDC